VAPNGCPRDSDPPDAREQSQSQRSIVQNRHRFARMFGIAQNDEADIAPGVHDVDLHIRV
jgi:hypothetical protein